MAFIQCSLTGTVLSWYIRLNDTYKQDWHAFVQVFNKQISSQKNAYSAQVEALNLSKKNNETVRHFALKVEHLVEKCWCNENASTINLKPNEVFTKGPSKNLKVFANKRQVKHTSTVLELSIPFHTLVNFVDAEDIANDKIRTHDLALEFNNNTKQLHTQTLESSSQEQLMFTQPKDPNNKNKPADKKYCSYCHRTNHSFSACFKKQRDDDEVEVPHVTTLTTKTIHKIDTILHLEIDLALRKVLPLNNTLDHDMILTNAIHCLTALHTDLRIDLLIDTTLALDLDHAPIPETIILQNIQIHPDHLLNQEILDCLDPVHTPILETKLI